MDEIKVKILIERPPVWDAVCNAFQINPAYALFAYADRIYNPGDIYVTYDLIVHERVHFEQQGGTDEGAALWWGKFLRDPEFRVQQEAEAYAGQYRYLTTLHKDRNKRFDIRRALARSLSGPLYNNVIGTSEAERFIHKLSGVK